MAENDIELSVGIKLDDAQFSKEYNNLLRNVSADTKKQIKAAVDETTGTASADWGQLPFAGMHSREKALVLPQMLSCLLLLKTYRLRVMSQVL